MSAESPNNREAGRFTDPGQRHDNLASPPSTLTTANGCDSTITASGQAIQAVENLRSGHFPYDSQQWLAFSLTPTEFSTLENYFQGDWFWEEKLRCDYFGSTQQFVLRMASPPHEILLQEIQFRILTALRFPRDPYPTTSSAMFAKQIDSVGSATIKMAANGPPNRHSPDMSFRHAGAQYPGVIVEIAYSQTLEALEQLAIDYISGSNGKIRMMVGIKIEFPSKQGEKCKRATFTIWESHSTIQNGKPTAQAVRTADKTFRNEEGAPNPDAELSISLSHFTDPATLDLVEDFVDGTIRISAEELCQLVEKAERYKPKPCVQKT